MFDSAANRLQALKDALMSHLSSFKVTDATPKEYLDGMCDLASFVEDWIDLELARIYRKV